jgi:hypothetical protein
MLQIVEWLQAMAANHSLTLGMGVGSAAEGAQKADALSLTQARLIC